MRYKKALERSRGKGNLRFKTKKAALQALTPLLKPEFHKVLSNQVLLRNYATELVQKRWKSLRDKFRRLLIAKDTTETRATSGNYVSAARLESAATLPSSLGAPLKPASQVQAASQPPKLDSPAPSVGPSVQELLGDMIQFDDQCLDTVSGASVHSDDASGLPVVCTYTQAATTSPQPAVADASATSTPAQRKGRKRKNDEEVGSSTQNVQDLCDTLKKTEPRNEHEHFGLCLAKYMRKVPKTAAGAAY
ncbi:hypothetical protein HPB52_022866 [Rhipicephalus sanguineus]|uniref:Uncharacterized protein n=1 Tax=Rhipicephalus sanguineus TaxID=34632 RepID=A0A9D4TBZ2_RHISA|nr:hypothetical protein HPB52_022866 [Rhipicephalus sanguineus]